MKRFILLLLIAAAVLLAFLMPYVSFEKEKPILEKGETYKAADLIAKAGGEVTPQQEYLKTDEVGRFEFTYTVKRLFFSKDVILQYEVVDTTPPELRIKEKTVHIKADLPYGRQEVLQNVSFNEGDIEFATDLDVCYPGNYKVDVIAKDEYGNASKDSYELIVDDDEAPFVFAYGDGAVIKKGSQFNIYNYIGYGDNADRDPILEIDGKVNTARVGDYPLQATLRDASGNETKWDLTIKVVNKISYDDDEEEEPVAFADFVKDYKKEGRSFGIDVSEWQGDIDFDALKKAGCQFIMIRIGFSRNGILYLDDSFKENLAGANRVGIPAGVYYYSNDKSEAEVKDVLRQIVAELGDAHLELPIVFDFENFPDFQDYGISFKDLDRFYTVFAEEAEKLGYEAMLYGSKYYLENIWKRTDERKIWLAHYTDWSSYKGDYAMWQTCAWGRIDGIDGAVDLDILFEE
ncbi:MAG: hypothetical protein IIZ28_05580 [Erysipelotrichaceae bacterium]|nr:hypothetical protein [Erysipelotrichaceae bacterium]